MTMGFRRRARGKIKFWPHFTPKSLICAARFTNKQYWAPLLSL
jgi:hypothetical protein